MMIHQHRTVGRGMTIIVVGILLKFGMVEAFGTSSVKCKQLYQSSLPMASTSRTTGRRRGRNNSSFSNQFITSNPSSSISNNEIRTPSYLPKVCGALAAIMLSISTITTLDVNLMTSPIFHDENINVVVVSSTEQPETWDDISQQSRIMQQQKDLELMTTSTTIQNLDQNDETISKDQMNESKKYDYYLKLCLAGGFASCLAHALLTPLDMIKTRMQSSSSTNNPLQFAKELCQTEGPMSLLKGFQSTALGYLLGGAVFFGGTEFFTQNLFQNSDSSFAFVLLCGAISVVMADIVVAPFEAMRIHSVTEQTNNIDLIENEQLIQMNSITTTKEEKDSDTAFQLSGLYTGFPALVIRDVPFHSTKFAVYDALSQQMHTIVMDNMMCTMVAGAIAGIAAAVISQPADAAFTQCCTSHSQQISPIDAFVKVWQKGTISNGLLSRCVFGAMLVTIQFTLYSSAKHVLFS